jgi:hypothetical protein
MALGDSWLEFSYSWYSIPGYLSPSCSWIDEESIGAEFLDLPSSPQLSLPLWPVDPSLEFTK